MIDLVESGGAATQQGMEDTQRTTGKKEPETTVSAWGGAPVDGKVAQAAGNRVGELRPEVKLGDAMQDALNCLRGGRARKVVLVFALRTSVRVRGNSFVLHGGATRGLGRPPSPWGSQSSAENAADSVPDKICGFLVRPPVARWSKSGRGKAGKKGVDGEIDSLRGLNARCSPSSAQRLRSAGRQPSSRRPRWHRRQPSRALQVVCATGRERYRRPYKGRAARRGAVDGSRPQRLYRARGLELGERRRRGQSPGPGTAGSGAAGWREGANAMIFRCRLKISPANSSNRMMPNACTHQSVRLVPRSSTAWPGERGAGRSAG